MEGIDQPRHLREILDQYKYALAVVLIGVVLLLLPTRKEEGQTVPTEPVVTEENLEEKLADILSNIEGVGKVEVLLTEQTGAQTHYQTDTEESVDGQSRDQRVQTVIVSDQERNESGLAVRTDPPCYLGALILCQGAESAQIRLEIVEAVSCVTGLRVDQISVLKMK